MDKKKLKDILSTHADRLVAGRGKEAAPPEEALDEAAEEELTPLLDVAERVQSSLRPITPSADFETALKRELLTTAHLRKAQGYVPPNPERDLMVLAALVGLAAMVAGIFIMSRLRH